MILVDTSIWANHFRRSVPDLVRLLEAGMVLMHPFVTAELALGNLRPWDSTVEMLRALPATRVASETELSTLVKSEHLREPGSDSLTRIYWQLVGSVPVRSFGRRTESFSGAPQR